jgi:L-2,4-diaminobutyrate decarboxylase
MGWGEGGVIAAPVDAKHRLTGAAVEYALEEAEGRRVIGIVASAGSTGTGAFDPLEELAALAGRYGLWLHVDAAHGASVSLSEMHKGKLRGIERADSIVWDAHKLLMMPALVTAVLFQREASSYEAFAQQASYLFTGTRPDKTWWDLGQRTLECTKRMMAIEVWTALRAHGEPFFADVVDRQIALASELAMKLAATDDFEVAVTPESNIVCYRHKPAKLAEAQLDAHNRALRQRVVEDGTFYVVGIELFPRGYFLRSTIMNPLTESRDLDELIEHLRALCPS